MEITSCTSTANFLLEELQNQKLSLEKIWPEVTDIFLHLKQSGGQVMPVLPIWAFKHPAWSRLQVPNSVGQVFESSGTTQDSKAIHKFSEKAAKIYQNSSTKSFEYLLQVRASPDPSGQAEHWFVVSLVPDPSLWPTSSLSFMIDGFKASKQLTLLYVDEPGVQGLLRTLERVPKAANVVVFGTSYHHQLLLSDTARSGASAVSAAEHESGVRSPFFLKTLFKNLVVVDTGGTKGRTLWIAPKQHRSQIMAFYAPLGQRNTCWSEYGMCELASQAWQTAKTEVQNLKIFESGQSDLTELEGNVFECNSSMRVLAAKVVFEDKLLSPCITGETGYLVFWDCLNTDSFCVLLTEDLGKVIDADVNGWGSHFLLEGRSPEGSVKGCSLQVKDSFVWDSRWSAVHAGNTKVTTRLLQKSDQGFDSVPSDVSELVFSSSRILDNLKTQRRMQSGLQRDCESEHGSDAALLWSPKELEWLQQCLEGCDLSSSLVKNLVSQRFLAGKDIGIVASANISIVTLFPVVWAFLLGARSVHVKLPSLRQIDGLSQLIFEQQKSLVMVLQTQFPNLFWIDGSLSPYPTGCQNLIVFGTDDTIQLFKSQLKDVRILGMGSFQNTFTVAAKETATQIGESQFETMSYLDSSAKLAAEACSCWWGRGCLTPLVVSFPLGLTKLDSAQSNPKSHITSQDFLTFVEKFADFYESECTELFAFHKINPEHFLSLRYLKLKDQLKLEVPVGLLREVRLQKYSIVVVIENHKFLTQNILSLAGQGIVFVTYAALENFSIHEANPKPNFISDHLGKSWKDWLSLFSSP